MHVSRKSPKPALRFVTAVAPDILSVQVEEGWIEGGVQIPYQPQPGETLRQDASIPFLVWIEQDGKKTGVKVADSVKGDQRFPLEKLCGEPLDCKRVEDSTLFSLNGRKPLKIFRKTKPSDFADPSGEETLEHMLYLVLPEKLREGERYTLRFPEGLLEVEEYRFSFVSASMRSEAVHVSQVGFRPDDPVKRAYLSQWMGLGGGVLYTGVHSFSLVDADGEQVYSGEVEYQSDGLPVTVGIDEITVQSVVYDMDFSDFSTPGVYRVCVEGIGCSYPFPIGMEDTWLAGFRANMNALYCQRSGIETGAPYSEFHRPRCYHPDDGRKVYHSECSLFESGNGLNCFGTDTNNFGNLVRKKTDIPVENAWGGYFDACDWDRRIQHLHATLMGLELYLMHPLFFQSCRLPIPESGNGVPDLINEGLYNIDHYRRMQTPEGGIRGGVEADEHPILGQCGWQDAWTAYAYKPDFWSAYYYTAAAARAAFALREVSPERSSVYAESAQRAMDWAEKEYAEKLASEEHKWTRKARQGALDQRELAAADMLRLTRAEKYDRLYRELRQEKSYEAAFVYTQLPEGVGVSAVKQECLRSIVAAAERALDFAAEAPFRLTTGEQETASAGPYASFYTIPHNVELIRAHFLTGDTRYLAAAIDACQFAAGANPNNLCYTTGVGSKYPLNTLHHDSRITNQETPVGITLFGPHNWNRTNTELVSVLRKDQLYPGAYAWPAAESFLDIYRYPCQTEYTVQTSIGPNAYTWGYLASRGR